MLHVYGVALGMLEGLRGTIQTIERKDRDLGRQMRRAGASVILNLSEGMGSTGGIRRERYRSALGSAREVQGCLDAARALGYVERVVAAGMPEVIGSLVKLTR